jgi:hypothetical protein
MKGILIGCSVGLGLITLLTPIAAPALIHWSIPLIIAFSSIIGLFGFIGYKSQQ